MKQTPCHLQRPDRYEMGLDLLKRKFNSILRFNWMAAGHVTQRTLLIGRKLWRGGFHHQSRRQQCRVNTIHLKSSTDEQNPAETVRSGGEIFENAKTEVMNEWGARKLNGCRPSCAPGWAEMCGHRSSFAIKWFVQPIKWPIEIFESVDFDKS